MRITVKMLRQHKACEEQVALFQQLFGDAVEVTEALCREHASKFDLGWASRLLPERAQIPYLRAIATARRAVDNAITSVRLAFDDAVTSAQRTYSRSTDTAFRARLTFDEAVTAAWRVYDEALAAAQRACTEVIASAFFKAFQLKDDPK